MGRLTGILSNTSMGTVGSTTAWRGTVALRVANVELVDVHALALGIGNCVGKEVLNNDGGLNGPPSLVSGGVVLLGHALASDTAGVFREGYDVLESDHIFHEFVRLARIQSLDVVSDLPAVLEVDAEVGSSRLGVRHSGIGLDGIAHHGDSY